MSNNFRKLYLDNMLICIDNYKAIEDFVKLCKDPYLNLGVNADNLRIATCREYHPSMSDVAYLRGRVPFAEDLQELQQNDLFFGDRGYQLGSDLFGPDTLLTRDELIELLENIGSYYQRLIELGWNDYDSNRDTLQECINVTEAKVAYVRSAPKIPRPRTMF